MYFKGNIIITDPGYILDSTKKRKNDKEITLPDKKDFMTYENILDYPDVIVPDFVDGIKDILDEKDLSLMVGVLAESKQYDKEYKNYLKACESYDKLTASDWELSNYGENLEKFGFTTYLSSRTYIGDWDCDVIEKGTNQKLGEFCADSGMVCVVLLDELHNYNPDFNYHIDKPWTTSIIRDFEGEIILKKEKSYTEIIGTGNINFYTKLV